MGDRTDGGRRAPAPPWRRRSRLAAALAACGLVALAGAGRASAGDGSEFAGHREQILPIVIVHGLDHADLPALAQRGAVGLLVPNAGPVTSGADALAGLVRGILYNARLPWPRDTVLVRVEKADTIPLHGPAIVLGMPPQHEVRNDRRYPIAVLGPGYRGVLVSSLTRVPGLVSMADVARTALQTEHRLRADAVVRPVAALTRLEARIEASRGSTLAGSVVVLVALIGFALLLPRGAPGAAAAALAANLALGWIGPGSAATGVLLLAVCTVAGGLLTERLLRTPLALGGALVAVLAAYAATMAAHPWALSLAPIGPELTSRFFGVANLLETLLLVPALLAPRLLGERLGPTAFGAVALLALATIAENRLGADGGGAIVLAVAYAVLAVGLAGRRWWLVAPALALAAAVVIALFELDAASSSPDHLRGALGSGLHGLAQVAGNRVPLSYARMLEQWYFFIPALATLAIGVGAARSARSRRDAAVVIALLAALGASLLVNDSPGPVTIAGLAAMLALEGGFLHRAAVLPAARRLAAAARPPAASAGTPVGRTRVQG